MPNKQSHLKLFNEGGVMGRGRYSLPKVVVDTINVDTSASMSGWGIKLEQLLSAH